MLPLNCRGPLHSAHCILRKPIRHCRSPQLAIPAPYLSPVGSRRALVPPNLTDDRWGPGVWIPSPRTYRRRPTRRQR